MTSWTQCRYEFAADWTKRRSMSLQYCVSPSIYSLNNDVKTYALQFTVTWFTHSLFKKPLSWTVSRHLTNTAQSNILQIYFNWHIYRLYFQTITICIFIFFLPWHLQNYSSSRNWLSIVLHLNNQSSIHLTRNMIYWFFTRKTRT